MPIDWTFAESSLRLGGADKQRIQPEDAARQFKTAAAILQELVDRPGVLLSDEVGMGKTYVALAVAASVIIATKGLQGPVVIMVPSRLRRKWQREWEQFRRHCSFDGSLDWICDTYAHSPTDFFKLLDDDEQHRNQLVFTTTGCFSRGFNDAWIKLVMIRLARQKTKLTAQQKQAIYRWAPQLIRQKSKRNLTEDVLEKLINADVTKWKPILVRESLLSDNEDSPVPAMLFAIRDKIDWSGLVKVLRESLPRRTSANIDQRMREVRREFNVACQGIYKQWLRISKWYSPLLILDEAHHAKNDHTQLAGLFRQSSADDVALLRGKFQRMLFLTATPFQLGHQELIRVIRSFDAVRWSSRRAPVKTREEVQAEIQSLEASLDANRLAGRRLDRLWGTIGTDMLGNYDVDQWWGRVKVDPKDAWECRLIECVNDCLATRNCAQAILRPWVIRHNRPRELPSVENKPAWFRRIGVYGAAVTTDSVSVDSGEIGLPVAKEAALPFLLTSRAQGELAQTTGARAFFAEGLSSSYEAFHHTRSARGEARDMDDNGVAVQSSDDAFENVRTIVPTSWYEQQVAEIIPSRDAARQDRLRHPKISATVRRAVELWEGGEKVLVFCFYRETCRALYEQIREEIDDRTLQIAGEKLGGKYFNDRVRTQDFLSRIARRCSEEGRPFYEEVRRILSQPFRQSKYRVFTEDQRSKLIEVLAAYFRAPSFLARYLPLDDSAVQRAWELSEGRREVLEPGILALRRGIEEHTDRSNQTYLSRVEQFLDFAIELAERARYDSNSISLNDQDEPNDPLRECLDSVSVYSRPRRPDRVDSEEDDPDDEDDGSYRVVPLVRIVHGDTPLETRERLALAFNSPLFPEVLVSSGVMGEGIDLHRFCRHVIHHDGYWNPSTLEQQTGRLDRIRCKAEVCRMPIRVYQPFIAGGADEKMFRVVRDRERWFQIVMGQKFEFDEGASEEIAARVPLPDALAQDLTFDLARWYQCE
ncbi:hypothetical protein M4951_06175 [Blastopirellula sp. J2-11]|uniref:helicase-related protein n=1 Tax=Blastopirellula sp. J2-11 TaxID=2943192 RepID=UPI0021CA7E8B|nr:helicase-related protein [Blastopirellula sp. J2-11]UUO07898.1 hypothetical protein M4951_06175 [Blastopirellula sp. J2-11]